MTHTLSEQVSVVVTAQGGLHARPAIKLSRLAKRFDCEVHVRADGSEDWVNAKSLVRLMALKVEEGKRLEFSARGVDAREALKQMCGLIERNFEEGEVSNHG